MVELTDLGGGRYTVDVLGDPTPQERVDALDAFFSEGLVFESSPGVTGDFEDGFVITVGAGDTGKSQLVRLKAPQL